MAMQFVDPEQFILDYSKSRYRGFETNDCVVKALAILFGIPYDEAHGFTRGFFIREERYGTRGFSAGIKMMMKQPAVRFNGHVESLRVFSVDTAYTVQKRFSKGIYLIDSFNHVSVLCDGVWIDYEGLVTPSTRVNAVYRFSGFSHYSEVRDKVKEQTKKGIDLLSLILLGLIAFALIFKGDEVKEDLQSLVAWLSNFFGIN